jgi:hypothetical protein
LSNFCDIFIISEPPFDQISAINAAGIAFLEGEKRLFIEKN